MDEQKQNQLIFKDFFNFAQMKIILIVDYSGRARVNIYVWAYLEYTQLWSTRNLQTKGMLYTFAVLYILHACNPLDPVTKL